MAATVVMSKPPTLGSSVKSGAEALPLAEAQAAAANAAAADGSNGNRRKRTRPVSACEACRAHKVKCILKADQPVCERCAASGKQCLFRIDDLRPDFRAERFSHLGPPGEGAREIKSRPKERRQSSSRDVGGARVRKASSTSQNEQDELDEDQQQDDGDDDVDADLGAAGTSKKPRIRRQSSGLLAGAAPPGVARIDEENQDITNASGAKVKNKPVFRSFANPSNLAAPAPLSCPPVPYGAGQSPSHRAPPPPGFAYPHPIGQQHAMQQAPPQAPSHLTYSPMEVNNGYPPYLSHTPGQAGPAYPPPPPGNHSQYGGHVQPQGQQLQGFSPGPPPHSRASSRYGEVPQAQQPYGQAAFQPSSQNGPPVPSGPDPTRSGMPPPAYSPYRGHAHHSSTGDRSSSIGANAASPADRVGLPPIRMAFPALRDEGNDRSATARIGDAERYSNASDTRSERPISPAAPSTATTSYSARGAGQPGGGSQYAPFSGDGAMALPPTPSDRAGDAHAAMGQAGSQGSKGSSGKKTSLVVPFFRWFGMTANTPGYRRIKVAVNPDLPTDEDSIQPGDQNGEEEGDPKGATGGGHVTAANLKGLGGKTTDGAGLATSPTAASVGDGIKTVGSTPKMNASDISRTRPPSNSHRPFASFEHESIASSSTRDLFDPSRPRYPRRDVLIHLSELFVKLFRTNLCPWVREQELLAGAKDASLPSILANSICAMTARFSDWAELKRKTPKNAGEPFSEMAKTLIVPMLSWPSLDVIEALILLSYAEFGSGSDSGLWMYSGMGMRMAMDLGIQHESTIQSLPTQAEQEKARWLFWSGCYSIDRITCFGTGRPVTMMEHAIDCLPPSVPPDSDVFYASQILQVLLRRGRMGELLNRKDDYVKISEKKARLSEMWQECAAYFQALPSSCAFSVQSFKRAAAQNRGAAFLFLHVLFQSTISLLERPGLMRGRETDTINFATPGVMHISASASRSIVDMINLANQVDPNSFHASPYLDQLILPTGRAFLQEREAIKEAMRQCGYRPGQSRQSSPTRGAARGLDERLNLLIQMRKSIAESLTNCTAWLSGLAHYWGGASWPARALEQEVAGEANVVPDVRDDDAMQAPLRDMELLSSWAKAKMRQAKGRMASRRGSAQGNGGPFGVGNGAMTMPGGGGAVGNGGNGNGNANRNRMVGVTSPTTATSIANLLAAANVASHHDRATSDGSGLSQDGNPLGLALSGQLATSAEIDIHALVDAWAAEQVKTTHYPSHMTDQPGGSSTATTTAADMHRPWTDCSTTPLPIGNTPSASANGPPTSFAGFASAGNAGNFPNVDFSALQLEELLSTELGMGSGDDVFPLELPVDEFPGHSQQSISSALFGFH